MTKCVANVLIDWETPKLIKVKEEFKSHSCVFTHILPRQVSIVKVVGDMTNDHQVTAHRRYTQTLKGFFRSSCFSGYK